MQATNTTLSGPSLRAGVLVLLGHILLVSSSVGPCKRSAHPKAAVVASLATWLRLLPGAAGGSLAQQPFHRAVAAAPPCLNIYLRSVLEKAISRSLVSQVAQRATVRRRTTYGDVQALTERQTVVPGCVSNVVTLTRRAWSTTLERGPRIPGKILLQAFDSLAAKGRI